MKTIKELKAANSMYLEKIKALQDQAPKDMLRLQLKGCGATYYLPENTISIDCDDGGISVETARALGQWLVDISEE